MKKMPLLFVRDFENAEDSRNVKASDTVQNGCEWVINGEGTPSIKRDGTSTMILNGELYARYDAKINKKTGKRKDAPVGAIPCQPAPDEVTGHFPHWVKVENQPEYQYHREAFEFVEMVEFANFPDGTYELCGPKLQGNPEGLSTHVLIPHGVEVVENCPRNYEGLKEFLRVRNWEGIVFAHLDGRMCKIRKKDFDYKN